MSDWTVKTCQHEVGPSLGVVDGEGSWVAKLHPLNGTLGDAAEVSERANMIAAAPDLLEACKYALGTLAYPDSSMEGKVCRVLRAAIAKAEGGAA